MENTREAQENWGDLKISHFKTGEGSLDEYRHKKTGRVVKIVMKSAGGELVTLECDPITGKLNELKEYDRDGTLIKFNDQKSIRRALQESNVWHARMLEEIKIQGGNASVAAAMIDQMLDEEILIPEEKQ